ncbi:MAG: hypothetical protein K2I64_00530 [Muribaculaceae bacterium]|nr:hypothetical protein [Muribaculaceae bacterium]
MRGGVNAYNIEAYAQSTTVKGVPEGSYIFALENVSGVETFSLGDVYYSTSTQSNVNAKSVHDKNYDLVYYYVPASEAPVSFMILPNVQYGFKSAENLTTGAKYGVNPQHVIIKASELAADQECRIKLDLIENVRSGRLTVRVDDPTDIIVQNRGNGLLNTVTSENFTKKGDKYECTINYSPGSEKSWGLSLKSGNRIFKATLDGEAQTRTNIFVYETASKASLLPGYSLSLTSDKHTVDVTTRYPDIDFPVTFKMVQDGGNETVQSKLDEKIEFIKIDGVTLDRSAWEGGKTFTVHNGSNLVYSLAGQVRTLFEVKERLSNGRSFGTSSSIILESETPGKYDFEIRALINNPVRLKVRSSESGYDKFYMDVSNYYYAMRKAEEDFTLDYRYTDYRMHFYPHEGYVVSKVTLTEPDGKKTVYECDEVGEVELKYSGMDAVYDVEISPYERKIPINVFVDGGSSPSIAITLGDKHVNREYLELNNGRQTIYVNASDFPIHVHEAGAKVYVNGVQIPEEGNHNFITEAPAAGSDVRIFSRVSSTYPVTIKESPAGYKATITMDGKAVSYGSFFALPGTEFVITPTTSTAGMILQTGPYSWVEPKDGKFTFTPKGASELTLRPKAIATIYCDAWESFELQSTQTGEVYKLQGTSTDIVLPYVAGATSTASYGFKISDPEAVMRIVSANGTKFSLNTDSGELGLESGAVVTLEAEKNPKPYYLNIHVVPNDFYNKVDPATGKYGDAGGYNEYCTDIYVTANDAGNGDNGGDNVPVPMFKQYLRYGDNNYYRDYKLHETSDEYNGKYNYYVSPTFNEFFNLTADQFPVTIHNGHEYNSFYVIKENNDIETVYPGNEYVIDCPTGDNYKVDVRVSLRYEEPAPIRIIGRDFYYQFSGREEVLADSDYGTDEQVYSFNTIKLRPVEGATFERVSLGMQNSTLPMQYDDIEPDENGDYIIAMDPQPFGSRFNLNFELFASIKTTPISADFSDTSAGVKINGQTASLDGAGGIYGVANLDNVTVTCDPNYRITSVVDKKSGQSLTFDPNTGKIYGLTEDMDLWITTEKYERNNQLTVQYYRNKVAPSTDARATLILAPGTLQESEQTAYSLAMTGNGLLSQKVYFNPADAPFELRDATYVISGTTYQDKVYLNNKEVPFVDGAYQFPGEIPDGSTLLILRPALNQVSDIAATADVESGLKVDVTVGGRPVADLSGSFTVPVAMAVKVVAQKDNEFDYKAEYSLDGGSTWTALPTAGYSVKSTDKQLKVRVVKTYNILTVNAAAGTSLGDLSFSADGVDYEVSGGNTIAVPTRVKSLTITTSKPDSYVDVAIGGAEGMAFDKDSGVLSNISTATLEIGTKTVVREHEVKVFLDNEDFDAGTLVLGNGKVIESSASLSEGYQSIQFGDDDLPLIYRITPTTGGEEGDDFVGDSSFDPTRPETMPAVFVNGEQLEYSAEHGGYIFPVEALTGDVPPVIKIYAPTPEAGLGDDDPAGDPTAPQAGVKKISVFYLVENGVKFEAIEDYATKVTEAGLREVLPSTLIELTAESENGDDFYVEVDGERTEPVNGKYTIMTGNTDITIAVKLVKLEITVNSDDWQTVRVTGNGFSYPMYDAASKLEFPQSTQSIVLRSEKEGSIITGIKDAAGNDCDFNSTTGELKVTDKMNVTVVMGDYPRDVELMIYVEEDVDEQQITHLILGEGTTVEKVIALRPGYQTVNIHQSDLPLAVTTTAEANARVYLGSAEIAFNGTAYEFPAALEAKSVVKIYTDEQPVIKLKYEVDLKDYDFTVWHDTQADVEVSTDEEHSVLPGTEISFMITPKAEMSVLSTARKAPEIETQAEDGPVVTVNDEDITPDSEGVYTVKATAAHAAGGLSIKAVTPAADPDDPNTGADEIAADESEVDVYNVNGILLIKGATRDEISKLPAGVYIVGGQKKIVR